MDGAVQGVAGSLSSGSAINYGAFAANSAKEGVQRLNTANVCTDTILGPLLLGGGATVTNSGNGNGNGNGNNGNGNGNGNNGNGNNGNGNGNNSNRNGNGDSSTVSQLLPNTNGVTYAVSALPASDCSDANAAGATVSCVLIATKGSVTRSATATVICTG